MADIRPFKALRYVPALRGELAKLLTPPYDVISPALQDELYAKHPKNLVQVDFGRENSGDSDTSNKYTRAAGIWSQWKKEGTIAADSQPAFYVYEQEFDLPGRGRRRRRGFFTAVRLESFEEGGIRAHERTFAGPKADRLRIMRATGCNLSPIFSIYDDPSREVDKLLAGAIDGIKPDEAVIDGIVHRLWPVEAPETISAIVSAMKGHELYIADGHHRYETSLNYREERRRETGKTSGGEAFDYTLMFLANTHDEGMEILPTHRVLPHGFKSPAVENILGELKQNFEIKELNASTAIADLTRELETAGQTRQAFLLALPGDRLYLLTLRSGIDLDALIPDPAVPKAVKPLDVSILHQYLLRKVWGFVESAEPGHDDLHYVKDAGEVLRLVRSGEGVAGFLMNPTKMNQVIEIAGMGMRMPQKSTYFYPKIITGMVIRDLNEPW